MNVFDQIATDQARTFQAAEEAIRLSFHGVRIEECPDGWCLELGIAAGWRAAIWPIAGARPPLRMTVVDPGGIVRSVGSGRRSVGEAIEAAISFVAGAGVTVRSRAAFAQEAAKLDARWSA